LFKISLTPAQLEANRAKVAAILASQEAAKAKEAAATKAVDAGSLLGVTRARSNTASKTRRKTEFLRSGAKTKAEPNPGVPGDVINVLHPKKNAEDAANSMRVFPNFLNKFDTVGQLQSTL
jgi:hypothetical protein